MKKLRVFLAEDHALVREGLKLLIERQDDMEVVGEADDGRSALETAKCLKPDLAAALLPQPGLLLSSRSAYCLVALAIIATPLHLDAQGQAEFIRRYLVQALAHTEPPTR